MFKKIAIEETVRLSKQSKLNMFIANPYWLAFNGFYEKIGQETLLFERDILYRNEFATISLPANKKLWKAAIMTSLTEEEVSKIEVEGLKYRMKLSFGSEYCYQTRDIINLKDKHFRKAVSRFQNKYQFKIKTDYSANKITKFLEEWESQQKEKNTLFDIAKEFEYFCLKQYKKIGGQRIFIEIDGKLVAYCLFMKLNKDYWVGVERKVNYKYEGLSRFLLYQEALMFKNIPYAQALVL